MKLIIGKLLLLLVLFLPSCPVTDPKEYQETQAATTCEHISSPTITQIPLTCSQHFKTPIFLDPSVHDPFQVGDFVKFNIYPTPCMQTPLAHFQYLKHMDK